MCVCEREREGGREGGRERENGCVCVCVCFVLSECPRVYRCIFGRCERKGGREGGKEGGRMRVWVHLDTLRVMGGNEGEKGVKEGR